MPGRNGCPGNEAHSIERAARELGAQTPVTQGYQEQSISGMIESRSEGGYRFLVVPAPQPYPSLCI